MTTSDRCFTKQVLRRDAGHCVICGEETRTVSAVMDWRLWDTHDHPTGNGVTLCRQHVTECSLMKISLEELRHAAKIPAEMPPQLYTMQRYDRWGNPILRDGRLARGELFYEADVYSALERAGLLRKFTDWVKYPRTFLLPWSNRSDEGERILASMAPFAGRRVIMTEKMDGENVTLYRNSIHARGSVPTNHFTRAWLDDFWRNLRHNIPPGWRICGEYLYARHTITYDRLPSYFIGFSVWNSANACLAWNEASTFLETLGISMVPVLYDGVYDEQQVRSAWERSKSAQSEGYVLRVADSITYRDFSRAVGKYVRAGYSQSTPVLNNIQLGEPIATNSLA